MHFIDLIKKQVRQKYNPIDALVLHNLKNLINSFSQINQNTDSLTITFDCCINECYVFEKQVFDQLVIAGD
jgi:hypothetical protein